MRAGTVAFADRSAVGLDAGDSDDWADQMDDPHHSMFTPSRAPTSPMFATRRPQPLLHSTRQCQPDLQNLAKCCGDAAKPPRKNCSRFDRSRHVPPWLSATRRQSIAASATDPDWSWAAQSLGTASQRAPPAEVLGGNADIPDATAGLISLPQCGFGPVTTHS